MVMTKRAWVLPVLMMSVLTGCGVGGRATSAAGMGERAAAVRQPLVNDEDLAGPVTPLRLQADELGREAIASSRGVLTFRAQQVKDGRVLTPVGSGVRITGLMSYPDFVGRSIPLARATVWAEAPGSAKRLIEVETDRDGHWVMTLPDQWQGRAVSLYVELGNRRWGILNYRWAGPVVPALAAANDVGEWRLDPASKNARAGLIHQIWNRAMDTFERENIALDWWTNRIGTKWPADGNYYTMGTVSLTDPTWWDVNGHEIGHAIFFAAFNSSSGGGQHKIDECYGADLAWSEGFASFFSGVISIDRQDPDARFEFMVPRRKPVRLENVPDDVCKGHTNEWRVSSAFWDLYDTNVDGSDRASLNFATIWDGLVKTKNSGRIRDALDAYQRVAAKAPQDQRAAMAGAFAQSGITVGLLGQTR
jgi:hypothetical protein